MRFDVNEWKERAHDDFEKAWHEGLSVLSPPDENEKYPRLGYHRAQEHPVFGIVERLRKTYLALGFDEICNPLMVEEQDVYRQFGPEAMAVLDRVFYLGGLPRPNVGISQAKLQQIGEILGAPVSPEAEGKLRETLHAYKKATIDGDDLVHEISSVLGADDAAVVHILDEVFPEFRELSPEASRTTLRSHMTSGWFLTLGALWERVPHPIRFFSVDRCFRREQQEGPTRLMTYHSASCVIAGAEVTNEEGKAVSEALLSAFGFTDFRFRPDEKRSKYYMPGTQTEVYARHPVHDWVEVATFGVYSPSALSEYGIGIPVMNLGLGVERLAMIVYGADDVRILSYPQFYPHALPDRDLVPAIRVKEEPATVEGRQLAQAIEHTARQHATDPGPCSFMAWEGNLAGTSLRVYVEEKEENTKLCGPACFNEIYVHQGSVLGIPDTEKWAEIRKNGISTGITYLRSISLLAAARIENGAHCAREETVQVKMARTASDININVEGYVLRHITSEKKKIDVRGPVFLTIRSEIAHTS